MNKKKLSYENPELDILYYLQDALMYSDDGSEYDDTTPWDW